MYFLHFITNSKIILISSKINRLSNKTKRIRMLMC